MRNFQGNVNKKETIGNVFYNGFCQKFFKFLKIFNIYQHPL